MVTPGLGVGKTRSGRRDLQKYEADELPAATAEVQAGVTWDRVPRPDPA